MKIAIIGAGAMGILFGGYLAKENDVTLIGVNPQKMSAMAKGGVRILEQDGSEYTAHPRACVGGEETETMDLVIVFVKAGQTEAALSANRALLGGHTLLMTLQNGSGHETILSRYAEPQNIAIGTTQHNSAVRGDGVVYHGGVGPTVIGPLEGSACGCERLRLVAETFAACGFACEVSPQIRRMIWHKLFTNASSSVLSGVLQTPQGFLLDSPSAWEMTETLIREAVRVANGDGMGFDEDEIISEIRGNLGRGRQGITSICADLRDGRKTEVDTISGSVVRASRQNGVPAPSHELMVRLVHAMEDRRAAEV